MYTLFVIILCYIIPVFITAFLFVFAYKVSHKEKIAIGKYLNIGMISLGIVMVIVVFVYFFLFLE